MHFLRAMLCELLYVKDSAFQARLANAPRLPLLPPVATHAAIGRTAQQRLMDAPRPRELVFLFPRSPMPAVCRPSRLKLSPFVGASTADVPLGSRHVNCRLCGRRPAGLSPARRPVRSRHRKPGPGWVAGLRAPRSAASPPLAVSVGPVRAAINHSSSCCCRLCCCPPAA